jgi:hypothetical protein
MFASASSAASRREQHAAQARSDRSPRQELGDRGLQRHRVRKSAGRSAQQEIRARGAAPIRTPEERL